MGASARQQRCSRFFSTSRITPVPTSRLPTSSSSPPARTRLPVTPTSRPPPPTPSPSTSKLRVRKYRIILAQQPDLPYGCDAWKHKTHLVNNTGVNNTGINGTQVNGTHAVPDVKGPNDVNCIKDTPFALCLMVFTLITLTIVVKAACRARAFLRHLLDTAHDDFEAPSIVTSVQAPPSYTASAYTSQSAPLLVKAPEC